MRAAGHSRCVRLRTELRLSVLRQCASALILRARVHTDAYDALPRWLAASRERLPGRQVIGWE
eukprot:874950-Pyramimonas_sp.AAC.1